MAARDVKPTDLQTRRERPWLYPYNRRLRHLHGISIRNISLRAPQGRPKSGTLDDGAIPGSKMSPAKALAQRENLSPGHSRSSSDLRAITEKETARREQSAEKADGEERSASPGSKRRASHKLRRRSTLDWQSESSQFRQKKLEDVLAANMADVFFSLHVKEQEDPVYVSEVAEKTMNPDFLFFNLREPGPHTSRLEDLVVKVWAKTATMEGYRYLVDMQVNLGSLQYIGKTIEGFSQPLPVNCVLFHLKDGIYTSFFDNITSDLVTAPASPPRRTIPITQILPTSSYDALMRLATLDECIQDALTTRATLEHQINAILSANAETFETVTAASWRKTSLSQIEDAIALERRRVDSAKRRRDELKARLQQRRDMMTRGHTSIQDNSANIPELESSISRTTSLLPSIHKEILGQRRRICTELLEIFPIDAIPGSKALSFSIRGLPLGNSVFTDSEDETTAAALGYVALLTHLLQFFLAVPLPYPITPRGSTSTISDPISDTSAPPITTSSQSGGFGIGKGRVYPLTPRLSGSARFRFDYAVFLLNKNIEILSTHLGLRVLDLRWTLPNLKFLLFVATAGEGEVPARKAGGIRGFLRGGLAGAGALEDSRSGSVDSRSRVRGGLDDGNGDTDETAKLDSGNGGLSNGTVLPFRGGRNGKGKDHEVGALDAGP